ncbi:thioredoxin family protein [Clostridium sp. cel8]|jgi:thioredoxin 1|uniref:glutaredoxin family protein n=1 Tax=unclassified Clostridium TaxID=2614128 RepID=UPI0015F6FE32|nr:thioredoxin family protein [Clostridium sp. cel8]MBA5851386.1 thioredoxin family protein [Clostridium sp. cel8]
MKQVYMFITSWCPYCSQALNWMNELKDENPEYSKVNIKIIDEEKNPEIAKLFDYYYVPTYFIDKKKVHEGVPSKEIIRKVFKEALDSSLTPENINLPN